MLRCAAYTYTIVGLGGIDISDPIHLKVKLIWHLSGAEERRLPVLHRIGASGRAVRK
jgi:hypothetical protein